jgi:hypothetical protein
VPIFNSNFLWIEIVKKISKGLVGSNVAHVSEASSSQNMDFSDPETTLTLHSDTATGAVSSNKQVR